MSCKWAGSNQPRVLPNRHAEDCPGDCNGCLPCTEHHCRVCYRTHAEGTCAECMAEVRANLHDIARMCGSLPAEVEHRGIDGEAMMLLGPSADPEARGHLEASVAAGRVSADYLADATGETHPLWVLGTWSMLWRDALEHDDNGGYGLPELVAYLDQTMTYMAGYEHVPFEDYARDLRRCRGHLEAVLHDGEQRDTGAPCMQCNVPLERTWHRDNTKDGWRCPVCKQTSSTEQYLFAVRADFEDRGVKGADKLSATDLAQRLGVAASTVRRWAGRIKAKGEDWVQEFPPALPYCAIEDGRRLYRVQTAEDIRRGYCELTRVDLTEQESA